MDGSRQSPIRDAGVPRCRMNCRGMLGRGLLLLFQSSSFERACLTSDCHKNVNFWLKDGSGMGYCFPCAEQYEPVLYAEYHKSVRECSVGGCTKLYKVTFQGKKYCKACNPDEESKRLKREKDRLQTAERRKKAKSL